MINKIINTYTFLNENHQRKMKIFRYLVSGGMATLTNIVFLYIFTDLFSIYYVVSAVMSYIVSFAVSFSMQKYWTFGDSTKNRLTSQMFVYVIINVINLGINALGIFILVNYIGIYYLVAQIVISIIIAGISFFAYRRIFRDNLETNETTYNYSKNQ